VVSGLLHLLIQLLDDRPWSGPVSWRKPGTFGLSFGITLAAMIVVSARLDLRGRTRAALLWVLAIDSLVEVGGITVQAWRDVPSHLNRSTAPDAAIAGMLAVGGAVLIVVLGWFAAVAVRRPVDGPADMCLAVRVGLGVLMTGLGAGAAMIARGVVEQRSGTTPSQVYADIGFLKGFHGVTLHAVVVLPALALLLEHTPMAARTRTSLVIAASCAYGAAALVALGVAVMSLL
jgi:hypothetical protein